MIPDRTILQENVLHSLLVYRGSRHFADRNAGKDSSSLHASVGFSTPPPIFTQIPLPRDVSSKCVSMAFGAFLRDDDGSCLSFLDVNPVDSTGADTVVAGALAQGNPGRRLFFVRGD